MKKHLLVAVLSIIFLSQSLHAQSRVDSLEVRLTGTTGVARLSVLADLIEALHSEDVAQALAYGREAETLLGEEADLGGRRAVWYWKGRAHERASEYDSVLVYGKRLEAWAAEVGHVQGVADGAYLQGLGHRRLGAYGPGLTSLETALANYEALGDQKSIAASLNEIGVIHRNQGDYDTALDFYSRSLSIREEIGNKPDIAASLNNLGLIHHYQGNYAEALTFFNRTLTIDEELGDKRSIAMSLNNIGVILRNQGNYAETLTVYSRSLTILEEIGDKQGIANLLSNIGLIHDNQGNYAEALTFYTRSLTILEEIGDKAGIAHTLNNIGLLYKKQGQLNAALVSNDQALALAEAIGALHLVRDAHEQRAEILERQERFAEALTAHKAFKTTHDSLYTSEGQTVIAELQQQYKTKDQQQQIQLLERDAQIQRLWRFGLLGGLVLAAAIAFLLYNRFRLKHRAHTALTGAHTKLQQTHTELKTTQRQLVQQEKMASLGQLTAGIAHEIKNPLNFVNNFAEVNIEIASEAKEALRNGDLAEVEALLDDVATNATVINQHGKRADGIVHAMMQHASGGTGQREPTDINALVSEHIDLAYHGKRAQNPELQVEIDRDLADDALNVEIIPQDIGRVLLNLLGNAFDAVQEHVVNVNGGYTPIVTVSTRKVDGQVEIRVSDNGPGIPAEIKERIFEPFFTTKPTGTGTGLGLSLSYDIVTQGHGGTLTLESQEGQGATFIVMLPVNSTETAY